MTTWFTADQHFGHKAIIKYCNRPFSGVKEMDETMIARWNERVRFNDIVYHLGDFTLSGDSKQTENYFRRLNGLIYMLRLSWHHDRRWLKSGCDLVLHGEKLLLKPPMLVLNIAKYGDGQYPKAIVLAHYPFAIWDRKHHGSWHLHGHCHGQYKGEGAILDVGVDGHDFYPWSLEKVAEYMEGVNGQNMGEAQARHTT